MEADVIPTCAELGIAVVAYSPLSHNLLTGTVTEPPTDGRSGLPRCGNRSKAPFVEPEMNLFFLMAGGKYVMR